MQLARGARRRCRPAARRRRPRRRCACGRRPRQVDGGRPGGGQAVARVARTRRGPSGRRGRRRRRPRRRSRARRGRRSRGWRRPGRASRRRRSRRARPGSRRLVEQHDAAVLQPRDRLRAETGAGRRRVRCPRPRRRGTAPARRSAVDLDAHRGQLEAGDLVVDVVAGRRRPCARARAWCLTTYSADSAWFAKLMSITEAGWPSAAARLTSRPSASRKTRRPSASSNCSTIGRATRHGRRRAAQRRDVDLDVEVARVREDGAVLHHLEVLARGARACRRWRCTKMSPTRAASAIGITRKPSITACSARSGSTSSDDHVRAHAAGPRRRGRGRTSRSRRPRRCGRPAARSSPG